MNARSPCSPRPCPLSYAVLPSGTCRSLKKRPASDAGIRSVERLQRPWPDLVIATGRRTAPIASWIRKQSGGLTRTVQMGRIGAFQNDELDVAVAPAYACLYPDPRRIDTAAPVTRVSQTTLQHASARWSAELASAPFPSYLTSSSAMTRSEDERARVAPGRNRHRFDVNAHYHGNKRTIAPSYYHQRGYYHDYDHGDEPLIPAGFSG